MKLALIVFGIDIIVLCVIYILLTKRIDRSFKSTELLSQIEADIDQVVTELNRTTDRNISLIEDRIQQLNALLEKADKRMVLFQREREKDNRRDAVVYTRPAPLRVTQVSLFDETPGEPTTARELETKPQPPATATAVKTSQEKVLEMESQGIESPVIASRLGMTLGEIELILSMNQRRKEKGTL